jgi:NAD(P)-dependent dehydrogenase (short-subunit alcohol dehydrogenase family)
VTAAPDRPDTAAEVDEVEAVARALQAEYETIFGQGRGWNLAERFARAALAARRPATEAEQAVERVRELADELDLRARTLGPQASDYDRGYTAGLTDGETYAADRIRAALDGAARDGSDG